MHEFDIPCFGDKLQSKAKVRAIANLGESFNNFENEPLSESLCPGLFPLLHVHDQMYE